MSTKNNPGNFDCYANAKPDEPMFILLGRDAHAPDAVRKWAHDRAQEISSGRKPRSDWPMVAEAYACADTMERYRESLAVAPRSDTKLTADELREFRRAFPDMPHHAWRHPDHTTRRYPPDARRLLDEFRRGATVLWNARAAKHQARRKR